MPIMVTNVETVTELKSQSNAGWLYGKFVMFNDDTHKWTVERDDNIRSQYGRMIKYFFLKVES